MNKLFAAAIIFLASTGVSAAFIPFDDLFDNLTYQSIRINPNGNYMLAKAFMDDRFQILAFRTTSLKALEVFDLKRQSADDNIHDFGWIDEDSMYVRYSLSGSMQPIKVIDFKFEEKTFDVETYEVKPAGFVVAPAKGESDKLFFALLNTNLTGYDLYKIDLSFFRAHPNLKEQREYFKAVKPLNSTGYDNIVWFHLNAQEHLDMFKDVTEAGAQRFFVYDTIKKAWKNFYTIEKSELKEGEEVRLDKFSPIAILNETSMAVVSNVGRDKSAVIGFDYHAKEFKDVLYESPYHDIDWASINSETGAVSAVQYFEKGVAKIKYLDHVEDELQLLKGKIGTDNVFVVDRSRDGKKSVVIASYPDKTSRFYFLDLGSSQVKFLQDTMPALYKAAFGGSEYLTVKSSDGYLIEAFLTVPVNKIFSRSPLIVMPHGGPLGVRDSNDFDAEVQALANRGYAVLRVNFRGSYGYGKEFVQAGRRELGRGIERDINSAVDLVLNDKRIDPSKTCIYGQSYGGYSALISVSDLPDRYKCAISAFGVTDLPLLFKSSNWQKDKRNLESVRWVVGDIETDHEKLVRSSPLYKAEQIKVPVLLFSGINDEIVLSEHSNRMKYMLQLHKKDVEYVTYKTRHGHRVWSGDRHQYLYIVDFLDRVFGVERRLEGEDRKVAAQEFYLLGEMLRTGDYASKDVEKAERFLRRAHELGDPSAIKSLRLMGIYEE